MIETGTVEGVQQGETALDFVRFDHALKNILDGDVLTSASEMIRNGEDGAQVVRRMTPYKIKS